MSKKEVSYRSDLIHGNGQPSSERTRDTGVDGLHSENLYDENETTDGELINPATGEPYDNSTMVDETHLQTTELGYEVSGDGASDDVMGQLPLEFDGAAQWLRQHEDDGPGDYGHIHHVA